MVFETLMFKYCLRFECGGGGKVLKVGRWTIFLKRMCPEKYLIYEAEISQHSFYKFNFWTIKLWQIREG